MTRAARSGPTSPWITSTARVPLLKSHSNAAGFDPAFRHVLAEAAELA